MTRDGRDISDWDGVRVAPGQRAETHITLFASYAGTDLRIPVYVWRGKKPGPTVFVSAAVHGDEINGTGAIRHIIVDQPFALVSGTLILVPVVNLLGFERHSRYLPDRRDLNRAFPGSNEGSLARRLARSVFDEIVQRCDYGIDLHTAAVRRTNFPNIRADMGRPKLAEFARAFGTELIVSGKGPKGSLRRSACEAGCQTLILEAGEVWKVEPTVLEYAVRGVRNCLIHLGMVEGDVKKPTYRVEADQTQWVRARQGGFLRFHVGPGDIVMAGEPIATNTSLLGREQNAIESPRDAIILGMTTLPSVSPGDPVCHLAYTDDTCMRQAKAARLKMSRQSLHRRARVALATNIAVSDADESSVKPRM